MLCKECGYRFTPKWKNGYTGEYCFCPICGKKYEEEYPREEDEE